jgi:uncharacterized protein (DUF983 family)
MARMSLERRITARAPNLEPARPPIDAMRRGAALTCPACGRGRLFGAYLKVADTCAACGLELHHHRTDDAPPYFTIVIVGHIVVAGALTLEQALAPSSWIHFVLWIPLALALSLLLLPRVKGALIGLQWANRMHGFGAAPDAAGPTGSLRRPGERTPWTP